MNHTFSYFETTYGIMNEMQVGIGESTCSGVFSALPVHAGGRALLSIDSLSDIAMERASSAREAVALMGALAEEFGFYGESASFEGGSESLVVIDPSEGWVFHVLADPTGTSAIWVAARVPDDSVAVVANMFAVREVDLADSANFLGRADMWELAAAQGLWAPGLPKVLLVAERSAGPAGSEISDGRESTVNWPCSFFLAWARTCCLKLRQPVSARLAN